MHASQSCSALKAATKAAACCTADPEDLDPACYQLKATYKMQGCCDADPKPVTYDTLGDVQLCSVYYNLGGDCEAMRSQARQDGTHV